MKQLIIAAFVLFLFDSCQKEKITIGTNVSDTFYLDNNGSSMHVLVEGNTISHAFLIFIHGGPGAGSSFYNTDYISQNIENRFACVYWDQRNAGASQGSSNGDKLNLSQMTDDLKKLIQLIKYRYGENSSVFILGHSFGGLLVTSFMTTGNNQSMVKG
jgi:pimeloyl-ACP methyl ester carboxylesterase